MKILPFTHIYKTTSLGTIHILNLFLIKQGTAIWETDGPCSEKEVIEEYLQANGFEGVKRGFDAANSILYYELDPSTDLDSFYKWGEVDKYNKEVEEVWRTLYWLETENEKGWASLAAEIYLGTICLSSVWEFILRKKV